MKTSRKIGMHDITHNGTCKGSWMCPNHKGSFRSTSHENQPNKGNMKTDPNNHVCKICEICEHYAEWKGYGARNVVDPENDILQQSIIWEITPVEVKVEQKKLRLSLKADRKSVKEQAKLKMPQLKIL